jgi:hypothetical protein
MAESGRPINCVTVAAPETPVVVEIVSHFHQVDIGKQTPDRQVDRFGYEPRLHENFVVQNCESLFLTRRKMGGSLAKLISSHV